MLPTVTILTAAPSAPPPEVSSGQAPADLAPVLPLPVPNMTTIADSAAPRASIRFDHATLRSEPAGTHTRYTIALTSRPDEAWYGAYAAVCDAAGLLKSFPVDRGRATVTFSCRVVEGPAHVIDMLEKLEELLVSAERRLETFHAVRPAAGPRAIAS